MRLDGVSTAQHTLTIGSEKQRVRGSFSPLKKEVIDRGKVSLDSRMREGRKKKKPHEFIAM
jgi:hypothetical protein